MADRDPPGTPPDDPSKLGETGYGYSYNDDEKITDLSPSTKVTLSRYLSDATLRTNRNPVDFRDGITNNLSTIDPTSGLTARLTSTPQDAELWALTNGKYSSRSQTFDGAYTGEKPWTGGPRSSGADGNRILRDAGTPIQSQLTDASTPPGYVSQVLRQNRFTVTAPSPANIDAKSPPDVLLLKKSPDNLGRHYTGNDDGDKDRVERRKLGNLAMVGHNLMARATGDPASLLPNFDATKAGRATAVAPIGAPKLGAPLPSANDVWINVRKILNDMPKDDVVINDPLPDGSRDASLASAQSLDPYDRLGSSWGSTYTPNNDFSGPSSVVANYAWNILLQTTTYYLYLGFVIAYAGAVGGYSSTLSDDVTNSPGKQLPPQNERDPNVKVSNRKLGQYIPVYTDDEQKSVVYSAVTAGLNNIVFKNLGVRITYDQTFFNAFRTGFKAYFGDAQDLNILNSQDNNGFKANVLRNMLRVLAQVNRLLLRLDLTSIPSSQAVRIINAFAQLGEAVTPTLYGNRFFERDDDGSVQSYNTDDSDPRYAPSMNIGDPANLYSALGSGGRRHQKISAADVVTAILPAVTTQVPKDVPIARGKFFQTSPPRERIDDYSELFKELEYDYVPFYFHDLRTNEVVGFHAFLSQLQDGFTAGVDAVEYFGRGEPVYTHKGSVTRNISLGFVIVATNPEDFKVMWLKINKLVTLLYPQYTTGRRVINENVAFDQPFSQLLGSSPLIRLRVGDVIKSNYSERAIKDLFRLDSVEPIKNEQQKLNEALKETIQRNEPLLNDLIFDDDDVVGPKISPELRSALIDKLRSERKSIENAQSVLQKKYEDALNQKDAVEKNFFDANNNTIIKSFREMGAGLGLAGFVDTMTFNWIESDSTVWETNSLTRQIRSKLGVAPRLCKVTMGFKPVHDIAPGLNDRGHNRAPIYPLRFMGLKNVGEAG